MAARTSCSRITATSLSFSVALEGASEVVVDLCAEAGTPISPIDAARQMRRLLERHKGLIKVTVHVSNQRAADAVGDRLAPRASMVRFATFGNLRVEITSVEITEVDADTVVNASNTRLELGGGVSMALRLAAGPRLQLAMTRVAPLGPRSIVETPSFAHARVRSILHVPTASGDPDIIAAAYANVLRVAQEGGYARVALPSLGTGTGRLAPQAGAQLLREALESAACGPAVTIIVALNETALADVFSEVLGAG